MFCIVSNPVGAFDKFSSSTNLSHQFAIMKMPAASASSTLPSISNMLLKPALQKLSRLREQKRLITLDQFYMQLTIVVLETS